METQKKTIQNFELKGLPLNYQLLTSEQVQVSVIPEKVRGKLTDDKKRLVVNTNPFRPVTTML